MVDLRDPRVDSWPLMSSIWTSILICVMYFLVVKVFGKKFMEKRNPYAIKEIMIAYNLFQTIFSFWMFKESWKFFVTGTYSWHCEPVDYSNNPQSEAMLRLAWWFFFSKFIDMFDTIFFVVRKKFNHVSFLHVFHHGTMPIICWWGPRYVGGGQTAFGPFLNSGVHMVMYLYYLLSSLGPQIQKYLWWKKYITILQLIQFFVVFFHSLQPFFFECSYPKPAAAMFTVSSVTFFVLFTAFYKKAYKSEPDEETYEGKKA